MSLQKSEHPVLAFTEPRSPRKPTLDTNPLAPPAEYYGKSHGPRKVAKSRTYSAVSPPCSPRKPHPPYDPQEYVKRRSSPSRVLTKTQHDPHFESVGGYKTPGRRASAGELESSPSH